MKTSLLTILLACILVQVNAQKGYVTLKDYDSTFVGYIRLYTSYDGRHGVEVWKDKKDKAPRRIAKHDIYEYAIKKDTFRIFSNYKPFHDHDLYLELAEGKLISGGKVNLYKILNPNGGKISSATGGGVLPAVADAYIASKNAANSSIIYVLERKSTGQLAALPTKHEELMEALMGFYPEQYVTKYNTVKGKIKYKHVPDLVKLYNSK